MATPGQKTRLCLAVTAEPGEATADRLAAALSAADIASVFLSPPAGRPFEAAPVLPLVSMAQKAGSAVLLVNDARLARTVKADGVHLSPGESFAEAREILGRGGIVGATAASRHDAMEHGEAGADYVCFAIPAIDAGNETIGEDDARELRLELVSWWAEIFEPPCLALDVDSVEETAALAEAGADFVTVSLPSGATVADVRDLVRSFAAAVSRTVSAS